MAAGQGVDPGQLPDLTLEIPPPGVDGDFAASYPLKVARLFRQPPRSLARQAADLFRHELVGSCEVAGPGFINIFLVEDWPRLTVPRIMATKDQRLCPEIGEERPVLVEYVSANPTGPLHIGHGRGAAYGSALVNLLSAAGYRVSSEHYLNDCGNQILNLARSVNARYLQALGVEAEMPADGYYGDDIAELAGRIVKESGDKFLSLPEDERIELFQRLAVSEKIKALKDDLAKFNVRFDNWFRESDLHERGEVMDVCRELQAAGFTYEKDGATWLRTTDFGDDKDRVLLRESGMPTYFAPDLAYHRDKLRRGFDRIINIWG
ncbi:MAG: arginine--tRNA ligase, partial [Negativicutes bacterium]|nr:arginine--tRNA ligase [Negativicutes bacterium]